ncbi:MAG: transposase, partial [Moorea sp. SIO2B7]|nr:transposase [Moorena sp. SIO2B7]
MSYEELFWGGGTLSFSDEQRFPVAVKNRQAVALPRYFGYGKGLTLINHPHHLHCHPNLLPHPHHPHHPHCHPNLLPHLPIHIHHHYPNLHHHSNNHHL